MTVEKAVETFCIYKINIVGPNFHAQTFIVIFEHLRVNLYSPETKSFEYILKFYSIDQKFKFLNEQNNLCK